MMRSLAGSGVHEQQQQQQWSVFSEQYVNS